MTQFKRDLYDKEIYVFTPKGDLLKFPKGATFVRLCLPHSFKNWKPMRWWKD